jgi:hypothetical protein
MGIHKEVRKLFGSSVLNYMISARTAQGYDDFQNSTAAECQDIITRWKQNKSELQSPRQIILEGGGPDGQESGHLSPKGFMQTRHLTFDERKRLHDERKAKREAERTKVQSKDGHRSCPFCRRDKPHTHAPRSVQEAAFVQAPKEETNAEFEQAIYDSVAATSHGNAEEDIMIERAIRASVRALQNNTQSDMSDPEALNRAIQASIAEAGRGRSDNADNADNADHPIQMTDEEAEHQALLEKALQESLATYQLNNPESSKAVADVDTDDDENIKLAIQESRNKAVADLSDSDEDLKLAIQNSKDELSRSKTEEEIVLDYVKRQSLAEEEHRKAKDATRKEISGGGEGEEVSAADEEALRLAIEESMKGADGASASGS